MWWTKVVTAHQVAKNDLKRSERFQTAYTVSSTIINSTDASKQIRFKDVNSLIDTYNAMVDNPVEISKDIIKDETFCTLWLKMHNNLLDKFYIKYGEAAFHNIQGGTSSDANTADPFSDWSECKVVLAIDPKIQEYHAKRPKHRRPSMQKVTNEIVDQVLTQTQAAEIQ
ncbi:MAG: hypothetical protein CL608_29935 [Anaerolineaceae bacterium]|nr:hypothetical protein [Anaerolineaceae bacterium]